MKIGRFKWNVDMFEVALPMYVRRRTLTLLVTNTMCKIHLFVQINQVLVLHCFYVTFVEDVTTSVRYFILPKPLGTGRRNS